MLLGMGFKKYIDTLKISKSIEMLLTTTKTISQISETLGFSNVSTYSRQFKNYLSVTPNAYRAMKKYDKYNGCSDDDVSEHLKSCVQSLICSKMPTNELDNYDEIVIDQYPISNVSTFYSVVQINSIDEIKMLFLQGIHKKIGYEGSNIIFCIMPNLCQYKNLFSQEEMNDIIKIIIEYRLHVAFSIDKIEQIYELNQLFTYQYDNLKIMNKHSVSDYNVQFIFNLNEKSIREIYRNILKIQNIELEYKIGLDISCMFNDTAQFKSLASQIKRLKFDYLYIDNARLKSPYLLDNEEGLLLKNILQFKHLIDDLKQFDFSSENLIFLNLYNHQLLNNNEIDLSNSAPLLFKTISKLKKHFKGYGLNVFSNPKVFNAVHLFDENGFKTTFGLIFNHLSWMTNQNQIEQRFYNIIENADQYYLYLYDWRVIESESNESDFKDVDIWINFEDEALIDEYICVIAKVDDEGGNINHMISQNLRHKYVWSTPFLMRVEENFRPYMHIMEHDFKKGPLKIRMKYNAVYLVEIYKKIK
ncbi:transcriptional regulator, AraC family [Staphylococcus epidermidis VCU123]|nr:transcriptional regulator, AraC family [Staphylococcus epidermidis VCU123]